MCSGAGGVLQPGYLFTLAILWLAKNGLTKIITFHGMIKYIWSQDINWIYGATQPHIVTSISASKRRGTASDESQTSDESAQAIFPQYPGYNTPCTTTPLSTDLSFTGSPGEELPTNQFMLLLNSAISTLDITNNEVQAPTCAPVKRENVELHITWSR